EAAFRARPGLSFDIAIRAARNRELLVAGGCIVLSRELPFRQDRDENLGGRSDQATVAQVAAQDATRRRGHGDVQMGAFRRDAAGSDSTSRGSTRRVDASAAANLRLACVRMPMPERT